MDSLTEHERRACMALIEYQPSESRALLLADLEIAGVECLNSDRSILRFHLPDYVRPEGQMPLYPEGTVADLDGVLLEVVVYIDRNRRLMEFELIRHGEGDVIRPNWATFVVPKFRGR